MIFSLDDVKNENDIKLGLFHLIEVGSSLSLVIYTIYKDTNISDNDFEHVYFTFKNEDIKLPDPAMSFMPLFSCNFSNSHVHLIMVAIKKINHKNMESILKDVFE